MGLNALLARNGATLEEENLVDSAGESLSGSGDARWTPGQSKSFGPVLGDVGVVHRHEISKASAITTAQSPYHCGHGSLSPQCIDQYPASISALTPLHVRSRVADMTGQWDEPAFESSPRSGGGPAEGKKNNGRITVGPCVAKCFWCLLIMDTTWDERPGDSHNVPQGLEVPLDPY